MLCTRCGEREAERAIYVEARPAGSSARMSSPEERRAREAELSSLCERCLFETMVPPEMRPHMQRMLDEQQRMYAAIAAQPASEYLRPLLDALEAETSRDHVHVRRYCARRRAANRNARSCCPRCDPRVHG